MTVPESVQTAVQLARAKINLTLHVGKARGDGYHPLESLVVFADIGDALTAEKSDRPSLTLDGPFADGLSTDGDNLILQAAVLSGCPPAKFHLTKNLPIASGIGGGSADAAAALRALQMLYGPISDLDVKALKLGADVPVCLDSQTAIMSGIGEQINPRHGDRALPAVLINPGVGVSTAAVFKAFDQEGLGDGLLAHTGDSLIEIAKAGRNDLQVIASKVEPIIADVLGAIERQGGCQLVRMSGSGSTCFGIFETREQSEAAAQALAMRNSNWWCVASMLGG